MTRRTRRLIASLALGSTMALLCSIANAQSAPAESPSSSLLAQAVADAEPQAESGTPHALRDASMFAISPPEPRRFAKHDLVQILVRETSRAESSHELETEKDYNIDWAIKAWPDIQLSDLLQLQMYAGRTTDLPRLDVEATKEFEGEGDYKREDDFTARLTAEVIDVLPNGNLVLEARTFIKTDEEEASIKVTGVCRPDDVTAANSVLSSQIHDLRVEKMHSGELKKTNEKGIIAKVLDTIFAF
jgi:flagellar L-ring protein precursor FlgH